MYKGLCIAMKLCLRDQMRKQQTFCDTTTFLHEMTSEKRAQKFHSDDASLPRSGLCFWLVETNFPRGTTNQKHYPDLGNDTSSAWNFPWTPKVASRNVGHFLSLIFFTMFVFFQDTILAVNTIRILWNVHRQIIRKMEENTSCILLLLVGSCAITR